MESLVNRVESFCLEQGLDKTYWIAYSGGMDSHVLLYVLAQLRHTHSLSLKAIHINHGLSRQAAYWAKHCAQICENLQIDFVEKILPSNQINTTNIEEMARQYRYYIFSKLLSAGDFVLTAHHQEDQAETVLLQLLRGSGPKGLSAMPHIKLLAKGFHGRPLLCTSHSDIKKYAEAQGLQWIEDESNTNTHFTRNFLRNDVIPMLKKRWPTLDTQLARVARHCAEAQSILDSVAADDLATLIDSSMQTLCIKTLKQFNDARQRLILREWIKSQNFPLPSEVKMRQIQYYCLEAGIDKSPLIQWADVTLRRYQGKLYMMKSFQKHDEKQTMHWDMKQPLVLPTIGILKSTLTQGQGLLASIDHVSVRFRLGAEKCILPGRSHHHSLKNLFQDWKIPPWERARIPLLFVGDRLIAVTGFFMDEKFCAKENEKGYEISLELK